MAVAKQELEKIPFGEAECIKALGERLKDKIIKDNKGGMMRRDAHPKMHGLVKAEFKIESGLSEELAIGLFAKSESYPAWVRFSNQDGKIKPDMQGDIRGMAIKLMEVSGEKILPAEIDAPTHDFIVISTDVFVTANVAEFDSMIKALVGNILRKLWFFGTHWRALKNVFSSMGKSANPLQIRYFSTTPYLLGKRAVKYSVIPNIDKADSIPVKPGKDFLREAMVRQLDAGNAVFDFCIQFQTNSKDMPVEDPGKLWNEIDSPFIKVATITIPGQVFDIDTRKELGEQLSFSPWHALPEHRPLGGINRARRVIYDLISEFRHTKNHQSRAEPNGFDGVL